MLFFPNSCFDDLPAHLQGAAATRNQLLDEAAACDYVIFLDDDVAPAPHCLDAYVSAFKAHPGEAGFAGKPPTPGRVGACVCEAPCALRPSGVLCGLQLRETQSSVDYSLFLAPALLLLCMQAPPTCPAAQLSCCLHRSTCPVGWLQTPGCWPQPPAVHMHAGLRQFHCVLPLA